MKKILSAALVLILVVAVMAACAPAGLGGGGAVATAPAADADGADAVADGPGFGPDSPITIRFTESMTVNAPATQPVLAAAIDEARTRGIIIEHLTGAGDDLRAQIRTQFAAGDPPDLFSWNVGANFAELVDADLLIEVDTFFANSQVMYRDMWTEGSWGAVTLDGGEHHWGIPVSTQFTGLIANRGLFQQFGLSYPTTYEELIEISEVFNANGIFTFGQGSRHGNPSHFTFDSIKGQFVPLDHRAGYFAGTTQFNTPEVVLAATYIQDMQRRGIMTSDPMTYGDWSINTELFNAGRSAMITAHPWTIAGLEAGDIDIEVIDWWTFPETVNDPNSFFLGGTNNALTITKSAYESDDARRAAIHEVAYIFLSDGMVAAFIENGMIAPREYFNFELGDYLTGLTYDILSHLEGRQSIFPTWGSMPNSATAVTYQLEFCDPLWALTDTPENLVALMQSIMDDARGS